MKIPAARTGSSSLYLWITTHLSVYVWTVWQSLEEQRMKWDAAM